MNTKSDCISCDKIVTSRQHAIQCERCSKWQHRLCKTGVTFEDYKRACKEQLDLCWVCELCKENVTTRKRGRN